MPFLFLFLAIALLAKSALYGQMINQVTGDVDSAKLVRLANHHPQWANQSNRTGLLSADLPLNLTLVLSRSPQQEQALKQLLADQQDLTSHDYHHWLSPTQMGERFGLSEDDITAIIGWLRSQGLHVNWVLQAVSSSASVAALQPSDVHSIPSYIPIRRRVSMAASNACPFPPTL